jgi:hypothetical protein
VTHPASSGPQAFGWVEDTVIGAAACVTPIEGGQIDAAIRAFGGDPHAARRLSLEAAQGSLADRLMCGPARP